MVTKMRIVVALGGNALLRRGEPAEAATQRAHVLEVASALADLASEHELVITHGNGPQVGLLALEADAYKAVAPYPLDILGAESQGMIGYLLVQALGSELPEREVVALLPAVGDTVVVAVLRRGDGQVQGERRLPAPALLADDAPHAHTNRPS